MVKIAERIVVRGALHTGQRPERGRKGSDDAERGSGKMRRQVMTAYRFGRPRSLKGLKPHYRLVLGSSKRDSQRLVRGQSL